MKLYRAYYHEQHQVRRDTGLGDSDFSHWEKGTGELRFGVPHGRIYNAEQAELLIRAHLDYLHRDDPMYQWLGFEEIGYVDVVLSLGQPRA